MRFLILCVLLVWTMAANVPFVDMWEEVRDAKCFAEGAKGVCLRVYTSIGKVDPNFNKTMVKFKPYKINVTGYIMPSQKVDVKKQAADIIEVLKNYTMIKMLAVVVEGRDWNVDPLKNVQLLTTLIGELKKFKYTLCIQTEERAWDRIMDRNSDFAALPLWWNQHDNEPEPGRRFRPFGGWRRPSAKQYAAGELCGNAVGKNMLYQ